MVIKKFYIGFQNLASLQLCDLIPKFHYIIFHSHTILQ